ncbi:MAG TPA: hypothetical protein VN043_11910 [Rhodanobacter sp.]|nr:hypothetical protein [Rhodanobacter sp.]
MAVAHPGLKSYYVRVDFDMKTGFTFHPHYLTVPANTLATITWFTDHPNLVFTRFIWCDWNEHCSEHPLVRGSYMVGAAQTRDIRGVDYWKYQVQAEVKVRGHIHHVQSKACSMTTNGLPAIRPR